MAKVQPKKLNLNEFFTLTFVCKNVDIKKVKDILDENKFNYEVKPKLFKNYSDIEVKVRLKGACLIMKLLKNYYTI